MSKEEGKGKEGRADYSATIREKRVFLSSLRFLFSSLFSWKARAKKTDGGKKLHFRAKQKGE